MKKLFLSLLICIGFALNNNKCLALFDLEYFKSEHSLVKKTLLTEELSDAYAKYNILLNNKENTDEFIAQLRICILPNYISYLKQLLEVVKADVEISGYSDNILVIINKLESVK